MDIPSQIAQIISNILNCPIPHEIITTNKKKNNGDYAINFSRLCIVIGTQLSINEFVEKLKMNIKSNLVTNITITGNFINFYICHSYVASMILSPILNTQCIQKRTNNIVIEYSSPNIAKPIHIGHLRSTILGNFLKNLFQEKGYNVHTINWLGDWGKQFGLLAVGFQKYGSLEKLNIDPLKHFYDVYVQINKDKKKEKKLGCHIIDDMVNCHFQKMENMDSQTLEEWNNFRFLSIEGLKEIYKNLNISFDVWTGESSIRRNDVEQLLQEIKNKNLLVESNGDLLVDLTSFNLGKIKIKHSNGTTTYITRDLVSAIHRWNTYKFDKMFYVVASSQSIHFQKMFKLLELLGYEWYKNCVHVAFGLVEGMSTRDGNVIFLKDVLEQARKSMFHVIETNKKEVNDPYTVSNLMAQTAVYIQDFSAAKIKGYKYDVSRMVSFEGNTGPFLQYTYARLCGIERKVFIVLKKDIDYNFLVDECAKNLIMCMSNYEHIKNTCIEQLEAYPLVQYLFTLSHLVAIAHKKLKVKNQPIDIASARLLLFHCAKNILGQGLILLGLIPLEQI